MKYRVVLRSSGCGWGRVYRRNCPARQVNAASLVKRNEARSGVSCLVPTRVQVHPHGSALTGSLPNFGFGKLSYGRYGRRESIVIQVENILTDIRLWSLRLELGWTS